MAYVKGSTTDTPVITLGKLDFPDIRSSLKQFFESSEIFTDYDFEGSALSTLLDVLSYNSAFYSYYANMIANESFLDTAQKRDSIGSLTKPLSYTPTSRRAARAEIIITNNSTSSKELVYGDPFFGGGLNWTPIQSYTIAGSDTRRIDIVQGNRTQSVPDPDIVDSAIKHQRFKLPHSKLDTTSLKVFVDGGNGWNQWASVDDVEGNIAGVTAGDNVYFLTSSYDSGYEIYFGDNVVGRAPVHDSKVYFDYLLSAGLDGNEITEFTSGVQDITVDVAASASSGGANEESVESIRTHAPMFFQTQGRAVTANDFRSIIRQDKNGIISLVWGGEDNDPPQYGRVFVSAIGEDGTLLTKQQKYEIIQLSREKGVVSILPEFVDPSLIEVILDGPVYYNLEETSTTLSDLTNIVSTYINSYPMGAFDVGFNFAQFTVNLLNLDSGLIGEGLSVFLRKNFEASPINTVGAISISFSNSLVPSTGVVGGVLRSNSFTALVDGGPVLGYLLDDGFGIIRHYTSGGDIIESSVGSLNTETGGVQIDGVEFIDDFYIQVRPQSNNISPKMGIILNLVNDTVELVD